jgi:hypothetical protein
MDIGQRKLKEAARNLRTAQKEAAAQHTAAHAKDTGRLDRGDGFKPYRVVGGDEHKSSHGTLYQAKMTRGETATNAGPNRQRTLMQKAIAKEPRLFDGVDSQFKTSVPTFYKRSTLGKDAGKRLMAKTESEAGNPIYRRDIAGAGHPIEPWVSSKIAKSQADAQKAARDSNKHFAAKTRKGQ